MITEPTSEELNFAEQVDSILSRGNPQSGFAYRELALFFRPLTKLRTELANARRLLELNAKIEAEFVDGSPEKAVAEICRLRRAVSYLAKECDPVNNGFYAEFPDLREA